jgi:hypothetical protein
MKLYGEREDLSRFLVHLTRDYDGVAAEDNLLSILSEKQIRARNAHCLVMHKIRQLKFSPVLSEHLVT